MSISRVLATVVAAAVGAVLGGGGFVLLIFSDRDRGAINEVFAARAGIEYLLPAAAVVIAVIVLVTILIARHTVLVARVFGFSSVAVLGFLLILTALLVSYALFVVLGLVVAIIGIASVSLATKAMGKERSNMAIDTDDLSAGVRPPTVRRSFLR